MTRTIRNKIKMHTDNVPKTNWTKKQSQRENPEGIFKIRPTLKKGQTRPRKRRRLNCKARTGLKTKQKKQENKSTLLLIPFEP